jgi:benzoyl-CoA-dihydrodiol lyase
VLPGTGGLTRVTDKRHVRHDLADIFCTSAEGVRGHKAKDWRLVDDIAKPAVFAAKVQERALALAAQSDRPADAKAWPDTAAARWKPTRCATTMSRWRSTAPSAPPPSP